MKVDCYLKRIGMTHGEKADYTFLADLQRQHMLTVPFENLDIMQGTRIVLDTERFFDKIVGNRRGGFCYELNGLFHWLLQELGFRSYMISGGVMRPDGTFGPEYDHMALLVRLEKEYIVDVGFGDSVRSPLPLSGEEVEDVSGVYRIVPDPNVSQGYFFQKKIDDEWVSEYQFTTIPRQLAEFGTMCHYHQTSPESHFTQKPLVSISTEKGRITLSGETLTITEGNQKQKIPVSSTDERNYILSQYFGIKLPGTNDPD